MKTTKHKISHRISSWLQQTWYAPPPSSLPWPLLPMLSLGAELYTKGLNRHQHQARQRQCGLPAFVISVGKSGSGRHRKDPLDPVALKLFEHPRLESRHPQQGLQEKRQRNREGGIYELKAFRKCCNSATNACSWHARQGRFPSGSGRIV